MLADRLPAPGVNHTGSGPDVGVGEARDVLLEEVDEAAFALKEGQELERGVRGGGRRRLGLGGGLLLGRRLGQGLRLFGGGGSQRLRAVQLGGIFAVEQHAEEHRIGEPEPGQKGERGRVGHGAQLTTMLPSARSFGTS